MICVFHNYDVTWVGVTLVRRTRTQQRAYSRSHYLHHRLCWYNSTCYAYQAQKIAAHHVSMRNSVSRTVFIFSFRDWILEILVTLWGPQIFSDHFQNVTCKTRPKGEPLCKFWWKSLHYFLRNSDNGIDFFKPKFPLWGPNSFLISSKLWHAKLDPNKDLHARFEEDTFSRFFEIAITGIV